MLHFRVVVDISCRETPPKQPHVFSTNPPTQHSVDQHSLSTYRLASFASAPGSTPLGTAQSPRSSEAAHRARIVAQLNDIVPRLP